MMLEDVEQLAPSAGQSAVRGSIGTADDVVDAPTLPANIATSIDVTLLRLEEVLDDETAALRKGGPLDLNDFNGRKSQALLELTRTMKHVQGGTRHPVLAERMAVVQKKLAENHIVLKRHLDAVREVSVTISEAIQEAESDGTYSPSISFVGRG